MTNQTKEPNREKGTINKENQQREAIKQKKTS
jgi:hypothetical protein